MVHTLNGHHRAEGGSLTPGELVLIEHNGQLVDEMGYRVRAERFRAAKDVTEIAITAPDGGAWEFIPARGECERVSLPVA